MKIIFPQDPTLESNPDSMFIDEVAAATHAGLGFALIDYQELTQHKNAARCVRDIPVHAELENAVYRGWMLRVEEYSALYDALLSRGIQLISGEHQYRHAQYLPEHLPIIKEKTPHTIWMKTDGNISYDVVMRLLLPFSGQPLVMKDFVQAQKHYWKQACYITSASDEIAVRNTVDHFMKLQGDRLEGGLVFREYVEFAPLTEDPQSGMPLVKEYRIFYLNHIPIATIRYWDVEGDSPDEEPDLSIFDDIARRVRSYFFTMDIAQRLDGEWMIIELGDGQVAGLPTTADLDAFYRALAGGG